MTHPLFARYSFTLDVNISSSLGLLLRSTDVCIVHLRREFKTRDSLLQMRLQRTDHDKHECLGIATQRILQKVG